MKKGKGGMIECPFCGTDVDVIDKDFPDHETMIQRLECPKCEKQFTELWECKNWEEVCKE